MAISAKEWELLSFFEVEPELLDIGVPWIYNRATYRVDVGGLGVTCVIEPSNYLFKLSVGNKDGTIYEISSNVVQELRYTRNEDIESLVVTLYGGGEPEHHAYGWCELSFSLKPYPRIRLLSESTI